jgi:hypothetical protein
MSKAEIPDQFFSLARDDRRETVPQDIVQAEA